MKGVSKDKRYNSNSGSELRAIKEKQFNNRYTTAEKYPNYEALDDPHATYYFSNRSVRKNLKFLRKTIKQRKNPSEESRITNLINLRLNQKHENFQNPKTMIYQRQLSAFQRIKLENMTGLDNLFFKTPHTKQKSKGCSKTEETPNLAGEETFYASNLCNLREISTPIFCKKEKHMLYANRLFEDLHNKKHVKWANFLKDKLNDLSKNQGNQRKIQQN